MTQLGLFTPPCKCRKRTLGAWPRGSMCDEGEALLQAKNEACYREGAIHRGEVEGDKAAARQLVAEAMRRLHQHTGLR